MREIEIKILEIDVLAITSKLNVLGAKKTFEGEVISIYYDCNGQLKDAKKTLRIRKKGTMCIISAKEKIASEDFKIFEELEVTTQDFEATCKIFELLGYEEISRFTKKRTSFALPKGVVEIDEYADIPPFLEVEATDEQSVKTIVEALGYSMQDTNTWSGRKVKEYYKKKN